jgi:hypothetical protein
VLKFPLYVGVNASLCGSLPSKMSILRSKDPTEISIRCTLVGSKVSANAPFAGEPRLAKALPSFFTSKGRSHNLRRANLRNSAVSRAPTASCRGDRPIAPHLFFLVFYRYVPAPPARLCTASLECVFFPSLTASSPRGRNGPMQLLTSLILPALCLQAHFDEASDGGEQWELFMKRTQPVKVAGLRDPGLGTSLRPARAGHIAALKATKS